MATKFDLNDLTPAAPAGRINIQWQFDATGNVSAHVPSVAAHQTPWLSDIDADQHDLNDLGVVRLAPVTIGEVDPSSGLVGFGNEEGTLHVLTGNGGSINLESIGNGRVMISTDSVRRIVVAQNGNVGIGPSMNPTYTLDVQGTCNVSGALTVPLSVQSALFKSSADMVFQVGAGFPERVRISATSGGVTITGTNAAGADAISGLILNRSYGDVGDSMDIVWPNIARLSVNALAIGEAGFIFYAQTGSGNGETNEVMRVLGNGTIGIKIASPAVPLHVGGGGTGAGTAWTLFVDPNSTGGTPPGFAIGKCDGIAGIETFGGASMCLNGAGFGKVGISTSNPHGPLQVSVGGNRSFMVGPGIVSGSGGICLNAIDDAATTNIGIELRFTTICWPFLRSSNPGGGTAQLWYDPADGNRVKFAP